MQPFNHNGSFIRPPAVRERAFTLVELILVLSILGILSAVIIPKIGGRFEDVRVDLLTDRMHAELEYVRQYAITNHDTTWFVVNEAGNEYGIYVGPSAGTRVLLADPHTGTAAVVDIDSEYDGVSITASDFGGSDEVSFNWWGVPSSGGSITLNGTRTLTLVAETGTIYE